MTATITLLPLRATYAPGDSIGIEVRGDAPSGRVVITRLGDPIVHLSYSGGEMIRIDRLPEGRYGVELHTSGLLARTALEVTSDPRSRMRYGFAADFSPDRDPARLSDTVRRLHLNGVMLYDWAYRHAELLGGGDRYEDPLGQPVDLGTVRRLVSAIQLAGSSAIGYVAVYAVGPAEWSTWSHLALMQADGTPFALGDFLFLVDPAAAEWASHFRRELRTAIDDIGFSGFHLDQFGYPKIARRADGTVVRLDESFARMIRGVREELPEAHLIFNNVNDFPTWVTAKAPQDVIYIEPWEPVSTLGALAARVARARDVADGKPIVLAAYQHVYDSAPAEVADRATALTMATLYSHGATQILAGEGDRILVDPYYVRNHVAADSTADMLVRWYDFLVEFDEVLMDPALVDATASLAGEYNADCDVTFPDVPTHGEAVTGGVWRRITTVRDRLVVHLINLVGQPDTLWDSPRSPFTPVRGGVLRVRRIAGAVPRVRVADPDRPGDVSELSVVVDGQYATATLPDVNVWSVVVIDLLGASEEAS